MEGKAKQDKGRHCRINATVTEEERAALDRLAISGFSVSVVIGELALLALLNRETPEARAADELRRRGFDVPGVKS